MFSVGDQPRTPAGSPDGGERATRARAENGAALTADAPPWPAVDVEELPWRSSFAPELLSRSQREQLGQPYRAAITPPIADLEVRLPRATAAAAEEASVVIRDFDVEVGSDVAPFAAILLRSESASSSEIENLTSGAKQIALAELGEDAKRNATQIVGNVHAMQAAVALSERLDGASILEMHRTLMETAEPEIAGRWREQQVWIGGGGYSPHRAAFVPPHARLVPGAIDDLVAFTAREDIPALQHAAIAHAQFETIHPFPDGNGRTGRALIHALLRKRALTRSVTVPVSAGLLVDTRGYFDALTAYRQGDPAPIVDAMAQASFDAVTNGRQLVAELRGVRERWAGTVKARSDSTVWPLMDLVLRQPVINTAIVQRELGVSHTNAMRAVTRLVDAGALAEVGGRRRSILWQSSEVLTALDAFAARAGRRQLGRP
ncbi:Fic family protein [Cellulomonas fimi]|uniref:Filamentation induced by cAMP protein Fic n=1 Tax=Cellulomonas fimi (strain ATCC 484 / DSM 20113 / JCM 1341 / CCUG 24087 / LMG 16345 / NBRC 15513 / NCIMB 8980 / NCTC 7547 / NRS-133) TaxID=590998 RepID=F4GYC6_CELFA|nr:Fic family protein [Cellulomonas fimi]AEE45915.1 filamentation induced by cAMP protein Fic [Cellulomonas fimi ATCC 484]VEH30985.1 Protein involved in cell division [Cellulomonas fimi]